MVTGAFCVHVLAVHVCVPVQRFVEPHDVPSVAGACDTPVCASHESVVQGFPSSTTAAGFWTHVPEPLHVCVPVQTFVEPQLVPDATGVCVTPFCALHESTVQGLPSSIAGGEPAVQTPF
jgi:hypothetical protein